MRYCETCIYKAKAQNNADACRLYNKLINLKKDYCSSHKENSYECYNCHSLIANNNECYVVKNPEGEYVILCPNCLRLYLR